MEMWWKRSKPFLFDLYCPFKELGIRDIILDPGFGFGKTLEHNYELMNGLDRFLELGYPLLAGISRKSMIYKLLGGTARDALNGTTNA